MLKQQQREYFLHGLLHDIIYVSVLWLWLTVNVISKSLTFIHITQHILNTKKLCRLSFYSAFESVCFNTISLIKYKKLWLHKSQGRMLHERQLHVLSSVLMLWGRGTDLKTHCSQMSLCRLWMHLRTPILTTDCKTVSYFEPIWNVYRFLFLKC